MTLLGMCSRLMAYNLSDGAERWWVGGLPPSGKSTPVIGDGLLFLAAPDIILETSAEERTLTAQHSSMRRMRLESWLYVRAPRFWKVNMRLCSETCKGHAVAFPPSRHFVRSRRSRHWLRQCAARQALGTIGCLVNDARDHR